MNAITTFPARPDASRTRDINYLISHYRAQIALSEKKAAAARFECTRDTQLERIAFYGGLLAKMENAL